MIKMNAETIGLKPLVIEGIVEKLTASTDAIATHASSIGTVTHNIGTKALLDTKKLFVEKEGEPLPTCAVTQLLKIEEKKRHDFRDPPNSGDVYFSCLFFCLSWTFNTPTGYSTLLTP